MKSQQKYPIELKTSPPGWFYTNERLEQLFSLNKNLPQVNEVFSIGGSGDFAFSFLSLYGDSLTQMHTCDNREVSEITQDLKSATIKCLNRSEITKLWLSKPTQKPDIWNKLIYPNLTTATLTYLSARVQQPTSIHTLKLSKLWYRDSFWQIKKTEAYLGYLTTDVRYNTLQKNLPKILRHSGDFFTVLQSFPDNYFDLIYVSNIFDTPVIQENAQSYLATIHRKLSHEGKLLSCNLRKPKKMKDTILKNNFNLTYEEPHRFSILSALQGHYDYSYFLYQKIDC